MKKRTNKIAYCFRIEAPRIITRLSYNIVWKRLGGKDASPILQKHQELWMFIVWAKIKQKICDVLGFRCTCWLTYSAFYSLLCV